jgi:hypothetical protein
MIVDGLLNLFHAILGPIVDALPKGNLPPDIFYAINGFASYVWSIDAIVPVGGPFVFMVGVVLTTVPAFITYRIGIFIYNKVRGS